MASNGYSCNKPWCKGLDLLIDTFCLGIDVYTGIVPWIDPTPPDIKISASMLAKALTSTLKQFLFDPHSSFKHITVGTIDIAAWTSTTSGTTRTLVLATNIESVETSAALNGLVGSSHIKSAQIVMKSNGLAEVVSGAGQDALVRLGGFGTIGFVI